MSVNNTTPAFTLKATGRLNTLITIVDVYIMGLKVHASVNAIWDTGATNSVITKATANKLGLKPSGQAQVHTANGVAIQNTYFIDIGLPNRVVITGITATEADALSGGCDALIGMDVITLGDFSITNHNGITCMSFRCPSCHEIDYVAMHENSGIINPVGLSRQQKRALERANNKQKNKG